MEHCFPGLSPTSLPVQTSVALWMPSQPELHSCRTIRNVSMWIFSHYCWSSAVTVPKEKKNKPSHCRALQAIIALWESASLLLIAVCMLFYWQIYMWEGLWLWFTACMATDRRPDWLIPLAVCCRWSCSLAASPASCRNSVSCPSSTSATRTWSECCSPHSSRPATTTTTTRWSCSRRWAVCCWQPSSR